MKPDILILIVALFLPGGVFVACDDSEQPEAIGTPPVSASEDVSAFFKTYLPKSSSSYPKTEFDFGDFDYEETKCFLINSMDEFRAIAPPSVELPVIDFEKYTLVIGLHSFGDPGFTLEKQAVDTESDEMALNLVYRRLKGGTPAVVTTFYFWGLYTKLPEKTVTVDITVI